MPIKWQPFKNFERPTGPMGPAELPELFGGEDGGMPFLPPQLSS